MSGDEQRSTIKRGDTAPPVPIQCLDWDDDAEQLLPVDIAPATGIRILGRKGSTLLIDRDVTGGADGVVTLEWETGDTATVGSINLEVEVTWPDGTIQTFPASGYLRVEVRQDLG